MKKNYLSKIIPWSYLKKTLIIMKLTIIVILISFVQLSASVYSQSSKYTIKVNNSSIRTILSEIENKTDFTFMYNDLEIDVMQLSSIEVSQKSINFILDKLFNNKAIEYLIVDKQIILRNKVVHPQKEKNQDFKIKTIKGQVVDCKNIPLPGVSVIVKGTTRGVSTDINGKFIIKTEDKSGIVLLVSFVGMKHQDIKIGKENYYKIILKEDCENLNEVVVTGIQTIQKGRATGSFKIVNEKEMDKIYSDDFTSKLEGLTPGVLIDNQNNIVIRGINTFKGDKKPLIVVDGIPTEMETSDINPNDIKQISILKDAASASIWGVRSSNGVIVITTKRGSIKDKSVIEYKTTFSIEEKRDLSKMKYLNSSEYIDAEWELLNKSYQNNILDSHSEVGYIYQEYFNQKTVITDQSQLDNLLKTAQNKLNALKSYNNQKDIEDYFYQNALTQKHNLTINSGYENISNFLSLNFTENKGSLKRTISDRINILNNLDIKISNKLKLSSNIRALYLRNNNNGVNPNLRPYERILNDDGSYKLYSNRIHKERYEKYKTVGVLDWTYNPLRNLRNNDNESIKRSVTFGFCLNYEIISGLKFSSEFSYDYSIYNIDNFNSIDHYDTRDFYNRMADIEVDGDNNPVKINKWNVGNKGGVLFKTINQSKSMIFRNKVSYNKQVRDFYISALAGVEHNQFYWKNKKEALIGFNEETNGLAIIDNSSWMNGELKGYNGQPIASYSYNPYRNELEERVEKYISYFGTANISYSSKYDLFLSARLDKTNLLVKSSKYRNNPTWSVGTKWNVTAEDFFKVNFIDNLSVKLSYGSSGLMAKDVTPDITGERMKSVYFPELTVVSIKNPENKNLGWEKTKTFNLGLSLGLFKKLNIDIDLYNKQTSDVLSNISLDPTYGWKNMTINSAKISNKGFDLNLNYRAIDTKVKLDLGLNYSYNKNEVTSVEFDPTIINLIIGSPIKGQPINAAWYIKSGGLDKDGNPQIIKKSDGKTYSFEELSSFTVNDYYFDASFDPSSFGGFTSNLQYKNWNLGILFTYKLGHKLRIPYENLGKYDGVKHSWISKDNRWIEAADNSDKIIPAIVSNAQNSSNRIYAYKLSSNQIDDADILRLKSINLSYNLSDLLKKTFIKKAQLKLSAENLHYWVANKYNLDSDGVINGFGESTYSGPLRRRFIASLSLTF